ncbi:hypothetical protein EVG20_g11652, partial [Dentipellis fragilis]
MSEKSEKKGEFTGWAEDIPEALPTYAPPRGPPPPARNSSNQPSGYSDDKGYSSSRGIAEPYYAPPSNGPYTSGSSSYPSGPSPYGAPGYSGPSQSQSPPQGYYPSPSGYSQGTPPYPNDPNFGQQFPGF